MLQRMNVFICGLIFLFSGSAVGAASQPYVKDEYLVRIKPEMAKGPKKQVWQAFENMGLTVQREYRLVEGLYHVRAWSADGVQRLLNDPSILYVAPNFIRSLHTTHDRATVSNSSPLGRKPDPSIPPYVPHNPEYKADPKYYWNYSIEQNQIDKVWKKYNFFGDAKTVVAIIDTGVDYTHPDLASNMWRNPGEVGVDTQNRPKETNGVDDDSNGFVDDVVGYDFVNKDSLPFDDDAHGTHVAGIAAAVSGNGEGIAGACGRCSIMALKFLGADGFGTDSDAISAIEYAVKMGARILNASWGSEEESIPLKDAFKAADAAGLISVVAAGNMGVDIAFNRMYPARFQFPGLLTIAAIYEVHWKIPVWSNYGRPYVHLSSGGVMVKSTVPQGKFESFSGTSMASPAVAGAVGLIWSFKPQLKATDIVGLLKRHVLPDPDSMVKTAFGGRPNLLTAFDQLSKNPVSK